jgi:uncharacterized membrane protein YqhA
MTPRKRVLAVDDEKSWRNELRRLLGDVCDIRIASTPSEFGQLLTDQLWVPDILVLDWLLWDDTASSWMTAETLVSRFNLQDRVKDDVIIITQVAATTKASDWAFENSCNLVDKDNLDQDIVRLVTRHPWSAALSEQQWQHNYLLARARQGLREREIRFISAFTEIVALVVNEKYEYDRFAERLLRFLVDAGFGGGAILLFGRADAVAYWPSANIALVSTDSAVNGIDASHLRPLDKGEAPEDLHRTEPPIDRRLIVEKILARELGSQRWFRRLAEELGPRTNHLLIQGEPFRNCAAINRFQECKLEGDTILGATGPSVRMFRDAFFIPIQKEVIPDRSPGDIAGFVILFDRIDGHEFAFGELETQIASLPIGPTILSALEMPFRYEKRSILSQTLNKVLARLKLSGWEIKEYILGAVIEVLRFSLLVTAILSLALPIYDFFTQTPAHVLVVVVHHLDLVVISFSVTVVSIGILALYDPQFTSKFGSDLPPWMARFGHINQLKRTILILICIIVAIDLLEEFVANNMREFASGRGGYIVHVLLGLSIIVVLGVFVRLNLKEPEESSKG